MAYKSFKRVFVETSLERKCLLMFGVSLLLVITSAFWFVERVVENNITDTARKMGRNYVDLTLLTYHIRTSRVVGKDSKPLLEMLVTEIGTQKFDWSVLLSDENSKPRFPNVAPLDLPATEEEEKIFVDLMTQLRDEVATRPPLVEELRPLPNASDANQGAPNVEPTSSDEIEVTDFVDEAFIPVSAIISREEGYVYYQPIYWKKACLSCHSSMFHLIDDESLYPELRAPERVAKVVIPQEEMRSAKTKSRAILLATAILTVFLAIIALYFVVHFIIIRPLNHLRDVSDEISRGNTNLRADIQTNDEYEELAASFNRMLRHMVETQEELKSVNSSLDLKVDELAQVNMQLHEMNRLKSDFLANMSHELRTPLNSIIGFSDVLRGIQSLDDKQKRYVNNIGKSGRILLEMINDILDLAKMESGKTELRLTEFELVRIVNAQCDLVRALAEEKNIDLKTNVQQDLPPVVQDQAKVQQILTNLLSNAIKFTPEGGRIDVTATRDDLERMVLKVSDTGVGIAEEDHSVIFEKFRQAQVGTDNLTREYSGTGLGLSIVKELCKLLGGEISFESDLGKGSCFTVRLPWKKEDQPIIANSLANRLNEVTNPHRLDFRRENGSRNEDGARQETANGNKIS